MAGFLHIAAVISLASMFPNLEWLSGPFRTMEKLENWYGHSRGPRGVLFTDLQHTSGFSQDSMTRLFGVMPTLSSWSIPGATSRDEAAPKPVLWLCEHEEEWLADWVDFEQR